MAKQTVATDMVPVKMCHDDKIDVLAAYPDLFQGILRGLVFVSFVGMMLRLGRRGVSAPRINENPLVRSFDIPADEGQVHNGRLQALTEIGDLPGDRANMKGMNP